MSRNKQLSQQGVGGRSHLVEAGLAEAAAEGGVAGPGQGQRPLCPVPLELTSLSINIYREVERRCRTEKKKGERRTRWRAGRENGNEQKGGRRR